LALKASVDMPKLVFGEQDILIACQPLQQQKQQNSWHCTTSGVMRHEQAIKHCNMLFADRRGHRS